VPPLCAVQRTLLSFFGINQSMFMSGSVMTAGVARDEDPAPPGLSAGNSGTSRGCAAATTVRPRAPPPSRRHSAGSNSESRAEPESGAIRENRLRDARPASSLLSLILPSSAGCAASPRRPPAADWDRSSAGIAPQPSRPPTRTPGRVGKIKCIFQVGAGVQVGWWVWMMVREALFSNLGRLCFYGVCSESCCLLMANIL
jgi:hypothetical protein